MSLGLVVFRVTESAKCGADNNQSTARRAEVGKTEESLRFPATDVCNCGTACEAGRKREAHKTPRTRTVSRTKQSFSQVFETWSRVRVPHRVIETLPSAGNQRKWGRSRGGMRSKVRQRGSAHGSFLELSALAREVWSAGRLARLKLTPPPNPAYSLKSVDRGPTQPSM